MRATSTRRSKSTDKSLWGAPSLIYAVLVALIIGDALLARARGILPLQETQASLQAPQLALQHVRSWNASVAQFPLQQAHDI